MKIFETPQRSCQTDLFILEVPSCVVPTKTPTCFLTSSNRALKVAGHSWAVGPKSEAFLRLDRNRAITKRDTSTHMHQEKDKHPQTPNTQHTHNTQGQRTNLYHIVMIYAISMLFHVLSLSDMSFPRLCWNSKRRRPRAALEPRCQTWRHNGAEGGEGRPVG